MKLFDVYPLYDINIVKGQGCKVWDEAQLQSRKKRAGAASFPDSIEHPSFRSCSSFGIRRDPILSTG